MRPGPGCQEWWWIRDRGPALPRQITTTNHWHAQLSWVGVLVTFYCNFIGLIILTRTKLMRGCSEWQWWCLKWLVIRFRRSIIALLLAAPALGLGHLIAEELLIEVQIIINWTLCSGQVLEGCHLHKTLAVNFSFAICWVVKLLKILRGYQNNLCIIWEYHAENLECAQSVYFIYYWPSIWRQVSGPDTILCPSLWIIFTACGVL